jgi:hypothetical protein
MFFALQKAKSMGTAVMFMAPGRNMAALLDGIGPEREGFGRDSGPIADVLLSLR